MLNVKNGLKRVARGLGYEVRRIRPAKPPLGPAARAAAARAAAAPVPVPEPDAWAWLRRTLTIGAVLDIGANNGEFAAFLHAFFRPRQLLLFEPLAMHRPALQARFAQTPGHQIYSVALGEQPGTAPFYRNGYDPSSSLLRVSEHSTVAFPQTASETVELATLARLDDLIDPANLAPDIFIKMDVQGVEDQVIRGGRKVFGAAKCVLVEMSFVPMYREQALFEEVHAQLVELGFRLAGLKNQVNAPQTGQPLFAHCFYLRGAAPCAQ